MYIVCMVMNTIYLFSFVEAPSKFIIAELSIRKLRSSSVLCIMWCFHKAKQDSVTKKVITVVIPYKF